MSASRASSPGSVATRGSDRRSAPAAYALRARSPAWGASVVCQCSRLPVFAASVRRQCSGASAPADFASPNGGSPPRPASRRRRRTMPASAVASLRASSCPQPSPRPIACPGPAPPGRMHKKESRRVAPPAQSFAGGTRYAYMLYARSPCSVMSRPSDSASADGRMPIVLSSRKKRIADTPPESTRVSTTALIWVTSWPAMS